MIKQIISRLWADSLYRNSFWLMAGSFSMAGIGFFYWIIAARLYTPEQIGLATTFLSAASLISSLAMLGFGTTLIRYLPTSEVKEKKINTAFTVVALASLVIGLIYLTGLSYWTPKLLFIRSSIHLMILMLLFFPINTINGITDSVFTALRQAHWVFVSNVTQSLTKLVALVLFASLGVWGVIGSNMVAVLVATALCLALIITRFNIHIYPHIDNKVIALVRKFSFGNYLSGLISSLPWMILPILITNKVSPMQTAYIYIPNLIASLIGVIPATMARSYLSESSNNDAPISMKKPLLATYAILFPSTVLIVVFGKVILSAFGKNYAIEGYYYLNLLTISILISSLNYFLGSRFLVIKKTLITVVCNIIGAAILITYTINFASRGVGYIGFGAIIYNLSSTLMYITAWYYYKLDHNLRV